MAAINGVKKSTVVKKTKEGKFVPLRMLVLAVVIALLLSALGVVSLWKFYLEQRVYDNFILSSQAGQTQIYRAVRDIAPGEVISGAVELTAVPSNLNVSNALMGSDNISNLKASTAIPANTLITSNNAYDPEKQDVVIATSRQVDVDYLETPGVVEGDFIDIRLKVYTESDSSSYRDEIVCSKKQVLYKNEQGTIELMLSESEILNLNNAVVDAVDQTHTAKLYVTKYVDPANQPKALVTYSGKGANYTQQEVAEAQDILKDMQDGTGEYSEPVVSRPDDVVTDEGTGTGEDTTGNAEGVNQ